MEKDDLYNIFGCIPTFIKVLKECIKNIPLTKLEKSLTLHQYYHNISPSDISYDKYISILEYFSKICYRPIDRSRAAYISYIFEKIYNIKKPKEIWSRKECALGHVLNVINEECPLLHNDIYQILLMSERNIVLLDHIVTQSVLDKDTLMGFRNRIRRQNNTEKSQLLPIRKELATNIKTLVNMGILYELEMISAESYTDSFCYFSMASVIWKQCAGLRPCKINRPCNLLEEAWKRTFRCIQFNSENDQNNGGLVLYGRADKEDVHISDGILSEGDMITVSLYDRDASKKRPPDDILECFLTTCYARLGITFVIYPLLYKNINNVDNLLATYTNDDIVKKIRAKYVEPIVTKYPLYYSQKKKHITYEPIRPLPESSEESLQKLHNIVGEFLLDILPEWSAIPSMSF